MSRRFAFGSCVLLLSVGPAAAGAADPARAGVTWEDTFEMSAVQGFKMPAQTRQSCRPARPDDWQTPPGESREDCRVTEMKRQGSRMSWKVVCQQSRMTGEGDVTWTADGYTGNVAMRSPDQGDMTMKIRGRKIGNPCDPERERQAMEDRRRQAERQGAEYRALAAQGQAQMCDGAVQNLDWNLLENDLCKPRMGEACARLPTMEGYRQVARLPETFRGRAEKACGADLASIKARLCEQELRALRPDVARARKDDPNADALAFISQECPAERQALIQRECAGRSYTGKDAPAEWIRGFCVQYAQEELQRGSRRSRAEAVPASEEKPQRPEPKDDALEKAKKAAKGILGF